MGAVLRFLTKEIGTTIVVNILWAGYKEYCKTCWNTFYKPAENKDMKKN